VTRISSQFLDVCTKFNKGEILHDELISVTVEKGFNNVMDAFCVEAVAIRMQQQLLDDCAFFYAAHLKMSFVMKKNVKGFEAHPSDYYEITSALDI